MTENSAPKEPRSLPSLAIVKPVMVTMLVITFIVLGVIAGNGLAVEFLPPMELPFLGCFITYPGGTPAQVEQEVAIVAEGEFRTLSNLENLYTFSSDNGCWVNLMFTWGTDMREATAEMRDRIERIRLELPPQADRIYMRNFSIDTMPVLQLGLSRPGDFDEFANQIRTVLLPKLQRLDGVAEVQLRGAEEKSVLVEFDEAALRRFGLSIFQVTTGLQSASFNLSVGELRDGQLKHLVRVLGEFSRPEELEALPIGNGLHLRDVASVGFSTRDRDWHYSIDGHRQIFVMVTKEAGANTVATCEGVMDEFNAAMATPQFEGTNFIVFMDQSDVIKRALNGLANAGKYGGLLALVVIFLFLGRIRSTLVVALAIPGSLVAGLILMYFADMTLNLVTMMSLIIAIGMVVDNAIVVSENIFRYRSLGYGPKESARRGANEVGLAITAATCTTAVVFLPVVFMEGGRMSVFTRQFALPVSVSLAMSLLIALTVIPLALSRFGGGDLTLFQRLANRFTRNPAGGEDSSEEPRKRWKLAWHPIQGMMAGYLFCLRSCMRNRLPTAMLIGGFIWLTFAWPARQIGIQAEPSMDGRRVEIDVEFDPNYDLAATGEVLDQLEAFIDERREALGVKNIFKHYTPRRGNLEIMLARSEDLPPGQAIPYSSKEVMNMLSEWLPERIPGARIRIAAGSSGGMGGGGTGQSKVSMRLQGDDIDTLHAYADRLLVLMSEIPEVTEAEKNIRPPEREIQLNIDEVLAERAGVSPTAVAQTVGFALMGTRLPELKQGGREISVWAQYREDDRKSRDNLENVTVASASGSLIPIGQLVDFSQGVSPQSISRLNGKNYIFINAQTSGENLANVKAELEALRDTFELPTGYTLSLGDELMEMDMNMSSFISALFLALILIYIVMGALFESWLLPLSILTSVPLAFLGVIWIMFLTGSSFDTIAFIGMILMVGLIVNNGIVIVDYINILRRRGKSRFDAVMEAGRDRLRPVLMTAITTILGAVPLAVGGGAAADAITGLGRALIGGLTMGTILTLFVVPLFYTFVDDFQIWTKQFWRDLTGLRPQGVRRV